MFIIAAAAFFISHTTLATLVIAGCIKINTCFFTHAVMYLHSNAG